MYSTHVVLKVRFSSTRGKGGETSFEISNLDTELPGYRELISPLDFLLIKKRIQRYSYSLIVNTKRIPPRIPSGAMHFQRNSIKKRKCNSEIECTVASTRIPRSIFLLLPPPKKEQRVNISSLYARNVRHFLLARSLLFLQRSILTILSSSRSLFASPPPIKEHNKFLSRSCVPRGCLENGESVVRVP